MAEEEVSTPVIVSEYLRYDFSEEEIKDRSKRLALAVQTKVRAQEEQKAAQAQFKERIEGADAKIGQLSRDINMGWEMRQLDCYVQFHTPVQGSKRIVRKDTGELVRDMPMQLSELQQNLFAAEVQPVEDSKANIESFFGVDADKESNG